MGADSNLEVTQTLKHIAEVDTKRVLYTVPEEAKAVDFLPLKQ